MRFMQIESALQTKNRSELAKNRFSVALDTVILASNENDLQHTLDKFFDYCQTWKLRVNINKSPYIRSKKNKLVQFSFRRQCD